MNLVSVACYILFYPETKGKPSAVCHVANEVGLLKYKTNARGQDVLWNKWTSYLKILQLRADLMTRNSLPYSPVTQSMTRLPTSRRHRTAFLLLVGHGFLNVRSPRRFKLAAQFNMSSAQRLTLQVKKFGASLVLMFMEDVGLLCR